eukprot:8471136-Alexandrium_andersonii.AAC.1
MLQQMRLLEQRICALESRPAGAGPESSGVASNPAGSLAAHSASAASRPGPKGLGAGPSLRAPAPVQAG